MTRARGQLFVGAWVLLIAVAACMEPSSRAARPSDVPTATAQASAVVAPSPTVSPDFFVEVPLIASHRGDVYRRTSTGWVRLASLCQEVQHLLIAPSGDALAATCLRTREMDGRQDVVLYDLRSGVTRRLSPSDGLDTFGRPVWSPDGTAMAYMTADGCPSLAPGCRTRIAVLDIATAKERTIPNGPIGELLWTPLGLSSYFEPCSSVLDCDLGPAPGTWLLTPRGWSHYSAHRLVSSDGRLAVLEEIATVEGRVRSVATIQREGSVERRLTTAGVAIEQALALVEDGRVIAWRPDHELGSGSTTGKIVVYGVGTGTRETAGTFSNSVLHRSAVLRPDDWIVVSDASISTTTLRAYSLKHDLFVARPADIESHRFVIVPPLALTGPPARTAPPAPPASRACVVPSAGPPRAVTTTVPARSSPTPVARPSLRVVATVDLTTNGSANIVFDERRERVYLLSYKGELVTVDAKTNVVLSTLAVSPGSGVVVTSDLALDPISGRVFVYFVNESSSSYGGSIAVIDAQAKSVVATIAPRVIGDFGDGGLAVNPVTGCVYSGNFSTAVAIVDAATNSHLGTIDLGGQTLDVAVDPFANRVLILTGGSVAVVDGSTNSVVDTFDVGGRAIAVNPTTGRVYVTSGEGHGNGAVAVLDGATGSVLKTLTVMNRPTHIAIDPTANRIYVANTGSGTVSVIDGATDEIVTTATVAHAMGRGIAADPRTGRIYVLEMYRLPNSLQVLQ